MNTPKLRGGGARQVDGASGAASHETFIITQKFSVLTKSLKSEFDHEQGQFYQTGFLIVIH